MQKREFTARERAILGLVQGDLPDSATPFADIAASCGASEGEVLSLVRELKGSGAIRRFGATLRHQKAGYGHNAMVAWYVAEDRLEEVGEMFASRPEISHCYVRRNCLDWPFNVYTMIHGQSPADCGRTVAELAALTGIDEYDILESVKELKKTSMKYF
ncbi:MAG: Lrp/AsnC family transcriptional regulator [Thermodesulfobacteriota bacterium]